MSEPKTPPSRPPRKGSRAERLLVDSGVADAHLLRADDVEIAAKVAEGGFAEIYKAALSPRAAAKQSPRDEPEPEESKELQRHRRARGRSFGRNENMPRPTAAAQSGELISPRKAEAQRQLAMKRASLKKVQRGESPADDAERERSNSELVNEFKLLAGLHHDNIISAGGIYIDKDDVISICIEFCENGSVREALTRDPPLTTEQRLSIALDTASGLRYLHRKNIVHCDVKSRNVLLSADYTAKLCDFGLSKKCSEDRVPLAGTKGHLAPELLQFLLDPYDGKSEMIYTKASDCFSFGIFLHELFTGVDAEKLDFDTEEEIDKLINEEYRPAMSDELRASEVGKLIVQCWAQDPNHRPTFETIVPKLRDMLEEFQQQKALKESLKLIRKKKKPSFIAPSPAAAPSSKKKQNK